MNILVVSFCIVAISWCNDAMQVNVTVGETVVLVCSSIPEDSSVQWVRMDLQVIYSNGDLVNPDLLNQTRYDVIGNQENGEFNFQIKHVMKYDEGVYRCDTRIEGKAVSKVVYLNVYENQDNLEKNCTEIGNQNYVQGFKLYTYMCIFGGVISALVIIPLTAAFGFKKLKSMYKKCHRINSLQVQVTEAVNNYDDINDIEIFPFRQNNMSNRDGVTTDHYVNERIYTEPESHAFPQESNLNPYHALTENWQSLNVPYAELATDLHPRPC